MNRGVALVLVPLVLASVAGCQRRTVETVPADRALVDVELRDASVSPDSHRSWTLLLDGEKVVVTVTDYEEVVHEDSVDMPAPTWRSVLADLADATRGVAGGSPDACAGGTTMTVTTYESAAADDVARAGADRLDETVLSSCDRSAAVAIDAVEEAVAPAARLVDLPDHARTWAGS